MTMFPVISSMQWLSANEVLPGEATHFTPWLAENLDLLADAVGLSDLTIIDTEVAVHEKRLDILATGQDGDGNDIPVIIENQYGITDHRHLGQIITYLAQQQHGIAVWIAEDFSQAHLAAVEFLNRTSIEGVGYLLLRVRFTHAAGGTYQVHFEVVAGPNPFIKSGTKTAGAGKATPAKVAFLKQVLDQVKPDLWRPVMRTGRPSTSFAIATRRRSGAYPHRCTRGRMARARPFGATPRRPCRVATISRAIPLR